MNWSSKAVAAPPISTRASRSSATRVPTPGRAASGLGLGGLAALGGDGDVGHRGVARGAVPVVLAGRNQDDVADGDGPLLVVGGDDAGPLGDDQDLIAGVLVELVARAGAEVDDAEVEGLAVGGLEDDLAVDVAGEQGAGGRLLGQLTGLDDFHRTPPCRLGLSPSITMRTSASAVKPRYPDGEVPRKRHALQERAGRALLAPVAGLGMTGYTHPMK